MNRMRRRYDIILKLTVLLVIMGCFFIAKTSDVKADNITAITINGDNIECTLDTSIQSTIQGVEIAMKKSDGTVIVTRTFTNSPPNGATYVLTNAAKSLLEAVAAENPDNTVSVSTIKYTTDGTSYSEAGVTDTSALNIWMIVGARDINNKVAANGVAISVSSGTVPAPKCVKGTSSSPERAYGYKGYSAEASVPSLNIDAGYYVSGWEIAGTSDKTLATDKKSVVVKIDSSNVSCKPVVNAMISNIKLTADAKEYYPGTDIYIPYPSTGSNKEYTVTYEHPTGDPIPSYDVSWIQLTPSSTMDLRQGPTADTIYVHASASSHLNDTITIRATVTDHDGGEAVYKQDFDFVFKAYKPVTDIPANGITCDNSTIYTGSPATFRVTTTPNDASIKEYTWVADGVTKTTTTNTCPFTFTTAGEKTVSVTAKDYGDHTVNGTKTFTVSSVTYTNFDLDSTSYGVTVGFTVPVTGTYSPAAAANICNSTFTLSNSNASISVGTANPTTGKVVANLKGEKAGDATLTYKITDKTTPATVYKESGNIPVTVYPMPTTEYSTSARTLKATLPAKVITGDANTDLDDVTGFKLYVYKGDSEIYNSGDKYRSSGRSYTVPASDIEEIIKNNAGKFSGDSDTIKFTIVPMGHKKGNNSDYIETNKNVKADSNSVTVYRVSTSGDNIVATQTYGLAGQSVWLTATPASGYTFSKWKDGSTTNPRQFTVSSSTSGNQHAAEVLGANVPANQGGGGSYSGDGYDAVPKTSESNSYFWLILISVFAVVGTGYALFMMLKPLSSNNPDDF